jgi:hypothetical protein
MNAHPIHFVSWRVPIFSKRSASGTNNNMKKEKGREKKNDGHNPFPHLAIALGGGQEARFMDCDRCTKAQRVATRS